VLPAAMNWNEGIRNCSANEWFLMPSFLCILDS
jgi:hypothetical protein